MTTAATCAIDQASSPRAVTDTYEYDAYGNEITSTGSTPNNYLYRAEQYDSDLGLYYLRARYYNPATGRFVSPDPFDGVATDPASLHNYLYADSDPADLADPSGYSAVAGTMPGRIGAGQVIGEYVVLVLQATAVTAVAAVGCAANAAYEMLAAGFKTDANITKFGCDAIGEGRMHIQLQYRKSFTVPNTFRMSNVDPPGVTLGQVGAQLSRMWGLAKAGGLIGFPNSLVYDLKTAIVEVSFCAFLIRAGGGTLGGTKNVCQGYVGNTGWRVDLDNDAGWNLQREF